MTPPITTASRAMPAIHHPHWVSPESLLGAADGVLAGTTATEAAAVGAVTTVVVGPGTTTWLGRDTDGREALGCVCEGCDDGAADTAGVALPPREGSGSAPSVRPADAVADAAADGLAAPEPPPLVHALAVASASRATAAGVHRPDLPPITDPVCDPT